MKEFRLVTLVFAFFLVSGCGSGDKRVEGPTEDSRPDYTITENDSGMSDLEFAIDDIEKNYCGFQFKITDENREEYEAVKDRLRRKVAKGKVNEFDAVAMYLGFFQDAHLHTCQNGYNEHQEEFLRKSIDYSKRMKYAPEPVSTKVTDKTYLIRFPSCHPDEIDYGWVDSSVDQYLESGCENLILDIRGNGGGTDGMYSPYRWLLSDHVGYIDGVLLYDTEENRRIMESFAPDLCRTILPQEGPSNEFVSLLEDLREVGEYDDRSPLPVKAALIIDNQVESSGEQLVLDVRACSDRCVIYGRDNTKGCIDFSNVRLVKLSGICQYYQVPMTISRRILKGIGVDGKGIAPDVRLDWKLPRELTDNIDEWVLKIAAELESNE